MLSRSRRGLPPELLQRGWRALLASLLALQMLLGSAASAEAATRPMDCCGPTALSVEADRPHTAAAVPSGHEATRARGPLSGDPGDGPCGIPVALCTFAGVCASVASPTNAPAPEAAPSTPVMQVTRAERALLDISRTPHTPPPKV